MSHRAFKHSTPSLQGRRLLLVEDEALVTILVEEVLTQHGAALVAVASTVAEASRLLEDLQPEHGLSAAILDLNLDGETVLPVADALARLGVPFLFSTGYTDSFELAQHSEAPVLHKPYDLEALVAALCKLIPAEQ